MKMQIPTPKRKEGSVLVVTLLTTAILGITLASYLIMVQAQNTSVVRSQTWNSSIALTEAGLEDGMQLLNKYSGTFDKLTNWPSTASSDGWQSLGGGTYYVRRYLGEDYYDVYVTNAVLTPSVKAQGYAKWHNTYAIAAGGPTFATGGLTENSPRTVGRSVDIKTKIDPIFNVAMAALKTIDFNGKNIRTDSFDSADPTHSENGLYPMNFPSRAKDGGDVVTDDVITNSLNAGNAKIQGQVKTGPKGTIAIGPDGSVGDKAWVEGGSTGIQSGHSANDMNVTFPMPTLPANMTSPTPPIKGAYVIDGITYDYVLGNGDYRLSSLGTGNWKIYVSGTARLVVTSDLYMAGQDTIRIADGASLSLYMSGGSARFGGNGLINPNGNATSFAYYGLQGNTIVNFTGNQSVTGTVYAPNADFLLGGGGVDNYDFIGASVTKTVKMNGHFRFHYDENLRNNGMGRGYIPTSWKES
jgi:hypothetical protein